MSPTWFPDLSSAPGIAFSALPITRSTSGMAANAAGSICAAQPVTTSRAAGRSRLALRICWRAWRTASVVTAQVLKTTASPTPSAAACAAIRSDS
jgi:hypothetical protein